MPLGLEQEKTLYRRGETNIAFTKACDNRRSKKYDIKQFLPFSRDPSRPSVIAMAKANPARKGSIAMRLVSSPHLVPSKNLTVAQIFLRYLALEGVDKVFGVPGGGLANLLVEFKNQR